jgi:hypothetical protein
MLRRSMLSDSIYVKGEAKMAKEKRGKKYVEEKKSLAGKTLWETSSDRSKKLQQDRTAVAPFVLLSVCPAFRVQVESEHPPIRKGIELPPNEVPVYKQPDPVSMPDSQQINATKSCIDLNVNKLPQIQS